MTLDIIAARLDNAPAILAAASRAGVDLALACALIEQESAGKNVYGHDSGGTYSTRDAEVVLDGVTYPRGSDVPVTEANYARFVALVASGAKSNGVGPAQITYRGYFPDAERRGLRLWLPEDNLTFGLQIIARHLAAGRSIAEAGTLYNAGNLTAGVTAYGRDLETKTDTWRARLATPPTGGTMTTYDFSRAQWGARPAAYVNALNYANVRHLIVHYPGTKNPIGTDVDAIARALRGWQDYHMDGRGWSDIAYNVAVDQAGRVWELRGYDRRDGATSGMGGVSMSVLAIVANDEAPTDALKRGVLRAFAEGRRRNPTAARGWHSMYASTSCPGDALRSWGRDGFPAPGIVVTDPLSSVTPKPAPAPASAPDWPLDNGCHAHGTAAYFGPREPLSNVRSVSGYYTHREDLRTWQRRMRERGWAITPDGLYGDETAGVARRFQTEKGLGVDSLIGAQTWAAAWTAPVTP